jgi:hypothetical protein
LGNNLTRALCAPFFFYGEEIVSKECFECGKPATEDHHVIPRALGGTKTIPLCGGCHSRVHGGYNKRRDDHNELVKTGMARARAEGKTWGFGTPGCTVDHAKVMKLSAEALEKLKIEYAESIIDKLIELRNQLMSVNTIAETLNKEGVKTQRGGDWYAKSVANIFDTLGVPFRDKTMLGSLQYIKKSVSDEQHSTQTEPSTSHPAQ